MADDAYDVDLGGIADYDVGAPVAAETVTRANPGAGTAVEIGAASNAGMVRDEDAYDSPVDADDDRRAAADADVLEHRREEEQGEGGLLVFDEALTDTADDPIDELLLDFHAPEAAGAAGGATASTSGPAGDPSEAASAAAAHSAGAASAAGTDALSIAAPAARFAADSAGLVVAISYATLQPRARASLENMRLLLDLVALSDHGRVVSNATATLFLRLLKRHVGEHPSVRALPATGETLRIHYAKFVASVGGNPMAMREYVLEVPQHLRVNDLISTSVPVYAASLPSVIMELLERYDGPPGSFVYTQEQMEHPDAGIGNHVMRSPRAMEIWRGTRDYLRTIMSPEDLAAGAVVPVLLQVSIDAYNAFTNGASVTPVDIKILNGCDDWRRKDRAAATVGHVDTVSVTTDSVADASSRAQHARKLIFQEALDVVLFRQLRDILMQGGWFARGPNCLLEQHRGKRIRFVVVLASLSADQPGAADVVGSNANACAKCVIAPSSLGEPITSVHLHSWRSSADDLLLHCRLRVLPDRFDTELTATQAELRKQLTGQLDARHMREVPTAFSQLALPPFAPLYRYVRGGAFGIVDVDVMHVVQLGLMAKSLKLLPELLKDEHGHSHARRLHERMATVPAYTSPSGRFHGGFRSGLPTVANLKAAEVTDALTAALAAISTDDYVLADVTKRRQVIACFEALLLVLYDARRYMSAAALAQEMADHIERCVAQGSGKSYPILPSASYRALALLAERASRSSLPSAPS